jgi:membrane protease YdiL (CAAX protease family)
MKAISIPEDHGTKPKTVLLLSVLLLLGINFTGGYILHNYFQDSILQVQGPGFWFGMIMFSVLTSIVLWNKKVMGWSWGELGLGKPKTWWKPVLVAASFYGLVTLFIKFAAPPIVEMAGRPTSNHLRELPGNLPMLITGLFIVWVTAAFLEELIFRAYLINVLDKLMGGTLASAEIAVVISAVLFGLVHSYQGLSGILLTGGMGFLAGVIFLFNGRRIWPLILIHGLIDTISFIHIYNM